jgi:hypothetical protein
MDIEMVLNIAQCELRAIYRRLGIQGSNVLSIVDEAYDKIKKSENEISFNIDFIKWYSGMSEEKILNAYKRYKKEKL